MATSLNDAEELARVVARLQELLEGNELSAEEKEDLSRKILMIAHDEEHQACIGEDSAETFVPFVRSFF